MAGILGSLGLDTVLKELGETARQVLPDREAQQRFDVQMAEIKDRAEARVSAEVLGQQEINKVEAAHENGFVAGWRPAMGWVGASGCGVAYVCLPLFNMFWSWFKGLPTPEYPIETLMILITHMLGISGIRTFEKVKGVVAGQPAPAQPLITAKDNATVTLTTEAEAPTEQVPTNEENAPWNRK